MLSIKNLSVRYGGIHALRDISFDVPAGQIVTLIGANGAGKSTTLNAIVGLVKAIDGSVNWNGREILNGKTKDIVESGVVLVPEGRRVFPNLNVDENLYLASRNLINVLVVEPRYADPLSLVHYKKVIVTKAAIDQLKEMFA